MNAFLARALWPLGWLYGAGAAIRNLAFDAGMLPRYSSRLPVISVGNVSVGGTGKTPVVAEICRILVAQGRTPVVLTRGYGGRIKSPHVVQADDSAQLVGDEPLMLHLSDGLKVVVSPQRVLGAQYIEQHRLGDVVVLDDGLQHRWLNRNLDLICLDLSSAGALARFRHGVCLPAGRFREPKHGALRRAQAVLLSARTPLPPHAETLELPPHLVRLSSSVSVENISDQRGLELKPGARVVALSAIASPGAFYQTLELQGLELVQKLSYADHHSYTAADIAVIRKRAMQLPIVITAKDAVKLRQLLPEAFVCRIRARIEPQAELLKLFQERGVLQAPVG